MPPRGNAPQPSVFQTDVQKLLHQKGIELYNGLAPLRICFAGSRLTLLANIALTLEPRPGIEPRITVYKTVVIPFNYLGIGVSWVSPTNTNIMF